MKSIQTDDSASSESQQITQTILRNGAHSKALVTTIPLTTYISKAISLPHHISYAGLATNMLAENDRKLLVWPYFEAGQEPNPETFEAELKDRYTTGDPDGRPKSVKRFQKVQQIRPYIMRYLEELDVSLDDIVEYLTDASMYDKGKEEPLIMPSKLHDTGRHTCGNAAVICMVFSETFGFSMWDLASARYRELLYSQASISAAIAPNGPAPCSVCNLWV